MVVQYVFNARRKSFQSVEMIIWPREWVWLSRSRVALGLREWICARNALGLRRRRLRSATTELERKERMEETVVKMRFDFHLVRRPATG